MAGRGLITPSAPSGPHLPSGDKLNTIINQLNEWVAPAITFAKLPASPHLGQVQWISDSNTVTFGATIAGSSTNTVLGIWDGTNWTVSAL